jgi:hypothetical protein
MGVDFRGYYASAQIVLEHRFTQVYNQELQKDYQAILLYRCPTPSPEPPLYVGMPYLPVFAVLFLPFALLDFTTSFYCWVGLQSLIFTFAMLRFSKTHGESTNPGRLLLWALSIPLVSNLYLGQINALLVLFLVEFTLAFSQGENRRAGWWLSTLLIKPHLLILLIPGFLLRRNWSLLAGFSLGSLVLLACSTTLVGFQGLVAIYQLTVLFAGPLIQTAHGMMNFRALALNLGTFLPVWIPWSLATLGGIITLVLVARTWLLTNYASPDSIIRLLVVTLVGTFLLSWHSHFYMLILLPPLLLYLDYKGRLPHQLRSAWMLTPPLVFLLAHGIVPLLERRVFGTSMLALNFYMLVMLSPGFKHPVLSKT